MTLKYFHLVFIGLSTLLSAGFAAWCWRDYARGGAPGRLALSLVSAVVTLLLVAYGAYFVRRMRGLR